MFGLTGLQKKKSLNLIRFRLIVIQLNDLKTRVNPQSLFIGLISAGRLGLIITIEFRDFSMGTPN